MPHPSKEVLEQAQAIVENLLAIADDMRRFVDLNAAETVEIRISADGKQLWVDTDGGNVLRIYNIGKLTVTDERKTFSAAKW